MSLADAFQDFERAADSGTVEIARFGRLALTRTQLIHNGESYPLRGMHISVDAAGAVAARPTLTRFLFVGPAALFWQKKIDSRQLFLTVEGPTFGFVVDVHADVAYGARQFVAKVNAAARALDAGNGTTSVFAE